MIFTSTLSKINVVMRSSRFSSGASKWKVSIPPNEQLMTKTSNYVFFVFVHIPNPNRPIRTLFEGQVVRISTHVQGPVVRTLFEGSVIRTLFQVQLKAVRTLFEGPVVRALFEGPVI